MSFHLPEHLRVGGCRPGEGRDTDSGFTLVELLVCLVIMAVAIAAAVQLSNIAVSSGRGNASAAVRNLISNDLNWLRWYAKTWRCLDGCTDATSNLLLRYTAGSCSTLGTDFISAAASAPRPPRPYAIAQGSQNLTVVNGSALTRTISVSGQNLLVTYQYAGNPPIDRFSSVLIQAGGWCT